METRALDFENNDIDDESQDRLTGAPCSCQSQSSLTEGISPDHLLSSSWLKVLTMLDYDLTISGYVLSIPDYVSGNLDHFSNLHMPGCVAATSTSVSAIITRISIDHHALPPSCHHRARLPSSIQPYLQNQPSTSHVSVSNLPLRVACIWHLAPS